MKLLVEIEKHIAKIHNVPVYGKLPKNHLNTLDELSKITTEEEWKGIKGIYCTDAVFSYGILGSYVTAKQDDTDSFCTLNTNYKNGACIKVDLKYDDLPAIFLSSFDDEYSFAINTMHELGHHVNGDNYETKDLVDKERMEINAHIFAMRKVNRKEFHYIKEPNFYYWQSARVEYIKRYGFDDHINRLNIVSEYLKEQSRKFTAIMKPVNWDMPKKIYNKFKKEINWSLYDKRMDKLPSPWRMPEVV